MFRALETTHVSSIDEIASLLGVTTADSTTPNRTAVMSIWLKNVLFALVIGVDCTADIANRDSEDTLPRRTVRARACPGVRDGI